MRERFATKLFYDNNSITPVVSHSYPSSCILEIVASFLLLRTTCPSTLFFFFFPLCAFFLRWGRGEAGCCLLVLSQSIACVSLTSAGIYVGCQNCLFDGFFLFYQLMKHLVLKITDNIFLIWFSVIADNTLDGFQSHILFQVLFGGLLFLLFCSGAGASSIIVEIE